MGPEAVVLIWVLWSNDPEASKDAWWIMEDFYLTKQECVVELNKRVERRDKAKAQAPKWQGRSYACIPQGYGDWKEMIRFK